MAKKCLIIANPISGLGFGRRNAPLLETQLRENGYEVELFWTTAQGAARAAAEEANADDVSVILCVGGDGTLNEIVNGVGDKRIPVTIFPTGTGNVLAKEYGIPYNVSRVCEMIVHDRTKWLDVGVIGNRRFILFAGAGFDAAVTMSLHRRRTGRISMLSYVSPVLRALVTYRFPEIEVRVDGQFAGTATCVIVSNVHSYGGPFEFTQQADPTDGLLDVCLMRGRSRWDLVRYMWGGLRRRLLRYEDTKHLRGAVIELDSKSEVPLQADGDFIGNSPVKIELLHARLPVIVP